jgi:DNA-binding MarR family transcriptional regulator
MDQTARTSFLIRRTQVLISALMEQELKSLAMTNGQYAVLSTIARRAGSSSAEIARRLRVKPQALNEFIPPLEQRGLIERTGHPDNRRILCVYLTSEGKRLLEQCDRAIDALELRIFSDLAPNELEQMRALSYRLIAHITRYEAAGDPPKAVGDALPMGVRANGGFE